MTAPFPNIYNHRKVADTAAKACDICYKMSTSVIITPDNKDFFYVCALHLKDGYFCTPLIDEEAAKAKREKELNQEKEKLKKEYQEKQRKKKEKEAAKAKDKDKDKAKGKDEDGQEDDKSADESPKKDEADDQVNKEPRTFELKTTFYQQRLLRRRQVEAAKRDRGRVSQPNYFPSVPTEPPSK